MSASYKLIPASEEGKEGNIMKTGGEVELVPSDIRGYVANFMKQMKELKSQMDYEQARITNVTQHHAFVEGLSGVELTAAAIFAQAKANLEACEAKLSQLMKQKEKDIKEFELIEQQTGIKIEFVEAEESQKQEEPKLNDIAEAQV